MKGWVVRISMASDSGTRTWEAEFYFTIHILAYNS
jgi:hypothetical protein